MELKDQNPEPGTPVVVARRSEEAHHVTQHWELCLGELQKEEFFFYIRNRLHTFVVERGPGSGPDLPVFVAPQDCDDGDLQRFELVPGRGGFYFIRSKVMAGRRSLVLEVKRASNRAKTPVVASPKLARGNDHQLWELLPVCPDARN
jgi:hypothetical protein